MSIPYEQLLGPGGQAREVLRASWGHWADEFCDGLLARRNLQDLVDVEGATFVSYGGKRIAVRWNPKRGWTYYDTIEQAVEETFR